MPADATQTSPAGAVSRWPHLSTIIVFLAARPADVLAAYHLHIPKTAGDSLYLDAARIFLNFSASALFSVQGCYSWRHRYPDLAGGVVLMLRDPTLHVLSQYLHCSSAPDHEYGWRALPSSFEGWVRSWASFQASGIDIGNFSVADPTQKFAYVAHPFMCFNPVNLQCQRLTCKDPFVYEALDVEGALRSLRKVEFVGIVEAYQASLCLLHVFVRGVLEDYCNCSNASQWSSFHGHHYSHQEPSALKFSRSQSLSREVWEVVRTLTAGDHVLYHAAVHRFTADVRAVEAATGVKVLCHDLALEV